MRNSSSDSPSEEALGRTLAEVVRVLDTLELRWTLAGALAADRYRASHRYTADADFLLVWHDGLPEALIGAGFELKIARDEGEVHLIRARGPEGNVDLIVAGTDYQRGAIERAVGGVLAIEDVLIHKVIAWRPKDRDDIRSILASGRTFDSQYVERWVREWDIEDRWREALTWR